MSDTLQKLTPEKKNSYFDNGSLIIKISIGSPPSSLLWFKTGTFDGKTGFYSLTLGGPIREGRVSDVIQVLHSGWTSVCDQRSDRMKSCWKKYFSSQHINWTCISHNICPQRNAEGVAISTLSQSLTFRFLLWTQATGQFAGVSKYWQASWMTSKMFICVKGCMKKITRQIYFLKLSDISRKHMWVTGLILFHDKMKRTGKLVFRSEVWALSETTEEESEFKQKQTEAKSLSNRRH